MVRSNIQGCGSTNWCTSASALAIPKYLDDVLSNKWIRKRGIIDHDDQILIC